MKKMVFVILGASVIANFVLFVTLAIRHSEGSTDHPPSQLSPSTPGSKISRERGSGESLKADGIAVSETCEAELGARLRFLAMLIEKFPERKGFEKLFAFAPEDAPLDQDVRRRVAGLLRNADLVHQGWSVACQRGVCRLAMRFLDRVSHEKGEKKLRSLLEHNFPGVKMALGSGTVLSTTASETTTMEIYLRDPKWPA